MGTYSRGILNPTLNEKLIKHCSTILNRQLSFISIQSTLLKRKGAKETFPMNIYLHVSVKMFITGWRSFSRFGVGYGTSRKIIALGDKWSTTSAFPVQIPLE